MPQILNMIIVFIAFKANFFIGCKISLDLNMKYPKVRLNG